jgi:hypothetical protein
VVDGVWVCCVGSHPHTTPHALMARRLQYSRYDGVFLAFGRSVFGLECSVYNIL